MSSTAPNVDKAVIRTHQAVLYASLELGYRNWLVTLLSPGSNKMSKRVIAGGDASGLVELLKGFAVPAAA